jgi:glycosyltransferase involved in cell wall biosynthesis
LGVPKDAPLIATIGRLQRGKGQHVFLRAAQSVLRERPDARFLIVGSALFGVDDQYPDELFKLAQELGLRGRAVFEAYRNDVPTVLAACDILVIPSITPEGFGMTTLEGMAAGRAIVATNIGATPELIQDGRTGLLVRPDSPADLANAVLRLLANPAMRYEFGVRARGVAALKFSIDRAVGEYEMVYRDCLGIREERPTC